MKKLVVANLIAGVMGLSAAFSAYADVLLVKPSERGLQSAYWQSLSVKAEPVSFGFYKLQVEDGDIASLQDSGVFEVVERSSSFTNVQPEPSVTKFGQSRATLSATEDDPYYQEQLATYWGDYIQSNPTKGAASSIASAKALLPPAEPVTVGIVDGGFFDTGDLNYIGGYSFATIDGEVRRPEYMGQTHTCDKQTYHGTQVASIIASIENEVGLKGIVNANIVAAKALSCGKGVTADSADAIYWLAGGDIAGVPTNTNVPTVINLSFAANEQCSAYTQAAIDYALNQGIVVVAGAGNGGASGIGGPAEQMSPANCGGVVTVAALTSDGLKSQFSNVGSVVDVAAQGTAVPVFTPEGFSLEDGTSFSTPIVAGALALVKQYHPEITVDELVSLLKLSTNATNPSLNDSEDLLEQIIRCKGDCGYGVLNVANLMTLAAHYTNNMAFSAGHPLVQSGGASCAAGVYFDSLGDAYNLCDLFEVNVGLGNGVEKGQVEVYGVPTGLELTVENGQLVNTFTGSKQLISDFDPTGYQYGFRLCAGNDETDCDESLLPITSIDITRPQDCQ